ncbi:MAG: hypothetical protein KAS21_09770 [Candidatus Aminicenantes bacterium]|nr:hypothetical protein [Candidatus Aminicenantes bacterium]
MKLFSKKVCLILVLMLVSISMVVSGQQLLKTKQLALKSLVKVELIATAKYYVGVCPVTIKMTGTIKVPKAMSAEYYFLRSDNAKSKTNLLMFFAAGSKNVKFSWKIGKDYQGWVQLLVKANGQVVKSKKVGFQVKCDKVSAIQLKQFQAKQLVIKPKEITRSIRVIYPNGGETFIYMRHHPNNYIKWVTKNIGNVRIWLIQGNEKVREIAMSDLGNNGAWYCGYDGIEGRFYPGTNFKIRVENFAGTVMDESDNYFTIQKAK